MSNGLSNGFSERQYRRRPFCPFFSILLRQDRPDEDAEVWIMTYVTEDLNELLADGESIDLSRFDGAEVVVLTGALRR